jgi:hypothetical protein
MRVEKKCNMVKVQQWINITTEFLLVIENKETIWNIYGRYYTHLQELSKVDTNVLPNIHKNHQNTPRP